MTVYVGIEPKNKQSGSQGRSQSGVAQSEDCYDEPGMIMIYRSYP